MLRLALPNISNVWQITLKDTSLISVTGLVEIMRMSYIAAGSTRDPLFFYSFATKMPKNNDSKVNSIVSFVALSNLGRLSNIKSI